MHHLNAHEAVLLLDTDAKRGLTSAEAKSRLVHFGPNRLGGDRRRGPLTRFATQFNHPLIFVLLVAGGVSLAIGQGVEAGVIFAVVLANAIVGFLQEGRAERALEALSSAMTAAATVIRDGKTRQVAAENVVPGDLMVLDTGCRVPADGRLLDVHELSVDESALTGESVPVVKTAHVLPEETIVADRLNTVFASTLVTRGQGHAVATATGAASELGLVHRLLGEAGEIGTPLTRKMGYFARVLAAVILVLAAATFAIGLARGQDTASIWIAAVALAVGAIPEGLPAAMTITLAIGVSRMARSRAIVRRLPSVETLGSTTVICTDKTGTLTKNEMTVTAIYAGEALYSVSGVGYEPRGSISSPLDGKPVDLTACGALRECLIAGSLCNEASLVLDGGRYEAVGDPTEAALLAAAAKGGIDAEQMRLEHPRKGGIPFESARRYMATVHRGEGAGDVVFVKGAVERVVAMCDDELLDDELRQPVNRRALLAKAHRLASEGLRVIAFARGNVAEGAEPELRGLSFVGLMAMMDPPRPEAIAAVHACHRAGIEVKMVTVDHAGTAVAIAARLGLRAAAGSDDELEVVTGEMLAGTADEDLIETSRRTAVFARVSAEQKLRLVEALQVSGEIVAMTGDGVNDAPALKQADIGVAMGLGGTEVAKEASDLVLADDNFASIEAAVEEGRHIFDNITKFIVWTLPTNLGEGLVILVAIALGLTLPILPVQILWINMTTAVALGLMLAFEAKEPDLMSRPPREPGRPMLTRDLVQRIVLVSLIVMGAAFAMFECEQSRGRSLAEARTSAVNVFVAIEIFYLLNCRSLNRSILRIGVFSNSWLIVGVAVTIVLQIGFTYVPVMNELFDSAPLDAEAWVGVVTAGIAAWAFVGSEKWIRQRV